MRAFLITCCPSAVCPSVCYQLTSHILFFFRTTVSISTKLGKMFHWRIDEGNSSSNERPSPFPSGDNYEIAKIHWQSLNYWANFNQTWHKVSLSKWNSSDEESRSSLWGCNSKIAEMLLRHWTIFFQEPLGQFQPNLTQSILGWIGFKFVQWRATSCS